MKVLKTVMNIFILVIVLCCTSTVNFAQTSDNKSNPKYGALAIDRSNGFYYGWSYDQNSLSDAETRALEECNNRGGNCSLVLEWSGSGCGAYRTIKGNVGTAYGWGLASTKEAADAIATQECLSRSNGIAPNNYVWACNSNDTNPLEELLNDKQDPPQTNETTTAVSQDYISFNGSKTEATGSCPSESVAMISADDETIMVLFNNIPSSGSTSVNASFFTEGCTSCLGITVQDISASITYVAVSGTFSKSGNQINFNLNVKELSDLIEGSGSSSSVSGSFVCEE